MEDQIRENEYSLIAQINLSEDDIELIRNNGSRMYYDAMDGNSRFDIQFAYYLMDVGMRFYDEGRYWLEFWNSIGLQQNTSRQQAIGDYFLKTLERYRLPCFDTGSRPFVSNILAHGFIPNRYSGSFFDFLYRFHTVVLRGTIPDDLYDVMLVISGVFADEDYAKKYPELNNVKLIASTRVVLGDETAFVDIVSKMLRRMGNSYDSIDEVRLGVYESQYREWVENLSRSKNRDRIGGTPYLVCDIERTKFHLHIPQRIVTGENRSLFILGSKGETLWSDHISTRVQFDMEISDEKNIEMNWDPLDEFSVSFGNEKIFTNRNDGFLLFNKSGKSHKKVSRGFNIVAMKDVSDLDDRFIEFGTTGSGCHVFGFMMGMEDSITIKGQYFSVEKTVNDIIRLVTPSVDVDCMDQDGNRYMLFDRLPILRVIFNRKNQDSSLDVICGINRFHADSLASLMSGAVPNQGDAVVNLDLNDMGLKDVRGMYTIRIGGTSVFKFILIPGFKYEFEEDLYEEDKISTMTFTGCDGVISFDTRSGIAVSNPISIDGYEVRFSFQVPSYRFRFDNGDWKLFGTEIYYREARATKLSIYCPTPVFPQITTDFNGKSDGKPLMLEVEGRNLVCDFRRIDQIGQMVENSDQNIFKISFKCGGTNLFTIRYTATYTLEKNELSRSNAPEKTSAVLVDEDSGTSVKFRHSVKIPPVGNLKVIEYYNDGFTEESRKAYSLKRDWIEVRSPGENEILSGNSFNKLKFNLTDSPNINYEGGCFRSLVSLDGKFDPSQDFEYFMKNDWNDDCFVCYPVAYNTASRIFLTDQNINRIKIRIRRFKESDPGLAHGLCLRYLKMSEDAWVSDMEKNLSRLLDSSNGAKEVPTILGSMRDCIGKMAGHWDEREHGRFSKGLHSNYERYIDEMAKSTRKFQDMEDESQFEKGRDPLVIRWRNEDIRKCRISMGMDPEFGSRCFTD